MSYLDALDRRVFPFIDEPSWANSYPATSSLAMTVAELAELNRTAAACWSFMNTAARAVINDRTVAEAVVGHDLAELLVDRPLTTRFARMDFVRSTTGEFKLIEVNADTPCGVVESYYANAVACAQLGLTDVNAGQGWRVHRLFANGGTTAFAANLDFAEDRATAEQVAYLGGGGSVVDLKQIRVTSDAVGVIVDGVFVKVDQLYALHPKEWLIKDVDHDGFPTGRRLLELAKAGAVELVNPLEAIVLQSKTLMALVHATRNDGWGHTAEVERYLPRSAMTDLVGQAYVRKPVLGREGRGVSLHAADGSLLRGNPGPEPALRQEFINSEQVTVSTTGGDQRGWLTFSKFIIDGEVDATYVRFNADELCGLNAYWVPVNLVAD